MRSCCSGGDGKQFACRRLQRSSRRRDHATDSELWAVHDQRGFLRGAGNLGPVVCAANLTKDESHSEVVFGGDFIGSIAEWVGIARGGRRGVSERQMMKSSGSRPEPLTEQCRVATWLYKRDSSRPRPCQFGYGGVAVPQRKSCRAPSNYAAQ